MTTRIAAALIDLSGTLHVEDSVIPGAVEALHRLRKSNVPVKFVTNSTKESLRSIHEKLTKLGFYIERDEIFTSLTAARKLVERSSLRPMLLLEEPAKEDFIGIAVDSPNAVVIGLAPSQFHYSQLNDAFRLLLNGAQLIAIHKGKYYQQCDGLSLGPGAFVTGLEYATGVNATVIGKPNKAFFHEALKLAEVAPEKAIMDVRDDVQGAMDAGLMAILVQTGKYRHGDEHSIPHSPTAVCTDFPAAVEHILTWL